MPQVWLKSVPFDKHLVTLALESGVDALITTPDRVRDVAALGRVRVLAEEEITTIALRSKADEETAVQALRAGNPVVLAQGWEVIPVENILAQAQGLGVEVASLEQARLAAGILERGVDVVVVLPEAAAELKAVVAALKLSEGCLDLDAAIIEEIASVGLGHRVCVDTCSVLKTGQGMLVGNSSAFTFLVHAETEENAYVAARPFRINAGAVHAYTLLPRNRTAYLGEIQSGREILVVDAQGRTFPAVVGRGKVEIRPLLLITAVCNERRGSIFLQNAETIRLVRPDGSPVSVVALKPGDEVLCRLDTAGRHFGMVIAEEISET